MTSLIALSFFFAPAPAAAQDPLLVSTAVVTVEQVYAPLNLRDPMITSTVYGDSTAAKTRKPAAEAAAQEGDKQPQQKPGVFSVYGLSLTGIMEDSYGRQALLRDTATGALYTLKAGKLRDSKKKVVPGVTGVVKNRQVVLMTEDKKVHQLGLPEKE